MECLELLQSHGAEVNITNQVSSDVDLICFEMIVRAKDIN